MTSESPAGQPLAFPRPYGLEEQRVRLRGLVAVCAIGVTERERARPQRLRLDIEVAVSPSQEGFASLEAIYDYGVLRKRVKEIIAETRAHLLEALAEEIADLVLRDPRVLEVAIAIDKIDRYSDLDGIGVSLRFGRSTP